MSKTSETGGMSFSHDKVQDPTLQRQRFYCKQCFATTGNGDQEAVLFLANNDDQKLTVMLVCMKCKSISQHIKAGF